MTSSLLGGLSPASFLRDHWQKRPLLVRQAYPGFGGIVDKGALFALARRDDAISRLVLEHPRRRARWELHEGPFVDLDAAALPASHWTLAVQGVESLVPGGWEILRAFSFLPAARIDDLMISYAAPSGSVGPHDDLYDVFLLQGPGRRRWQVSAGGDRALDEAAPIKVLKSLVPEDEWVLDPGDMLYLPPGVAHWGVAEGPCFTYSIGFLAPTHEALLQNFLGYLGQTLATGPTVDPDGIYQDPDLRPQPRALEIGEAMVDQVASLLDKLRWDRAEIGVFLGRLLTGPKPQVKFARPRSLSRDAFARRLRGGHGRLALALPSRGLVRGAHLFFNGEAHAVEPATLRLFERLAGERSVPLPVAATLGADALRLFHGWYLAGYLVLG